MIMQRVLQKMAISECHQVFYLILVRIGRRHSIVKHAAMDDLRDGVCLVLLKTTTLKAPALIGARGCQPLEAGVYKHPSAQTDSRVIYVGHQHVFVSPLRRSTRAQCMLSPK